MADKSSTSWAARSLPYSIPTRILKGTYALNIKTLYDEFQRNYPGHGGIMTMRTLDEYGIARKDPRTISDSDPFYATGDAFISNSGKIVLIEIIPSDGIPGWIELKNTTEYEAVAIEDAGAAAVARWFTTNYDPKRVTYIPEETKLI